MIRVIAIDDEPLALRQLEMYIAKVPFLKLVAACSSAAMAAPYVAKADALFLDINMPDLSGMDFIKSLPHPSVSRNLKHPAKSFGSIWRCRRR